MSIATFYLLSQPEMLSKLIKELETVVTDANSLPSWAILERLPYFISLLHISNPFTLLMILTAL
jgi:hypothetical protein